MPNAGARVDMTSPGTALPQSMHVLERGWLSSNQVVFLDDECTASIVDTGYIKHKAMTLNLAQHVLRGRQLTRVINTHLHADHCGGNAVLQAAYGCEIWVPPASWQASRDWDLKTLNFPAVGQLCERFRPTHCLAPGTDIVLGGLRWQVHAAPGHDPESIVLFEPEYRILISADALWEDGFGVIFPELSGQSGFSEQAAILELIDKLAPVTVIPGHGSVFSDVPAALLRAKRRLDAMRVDAKRHAGHAMKVLVMFLLMELEKATDQEVHQRLCSGVIVQDTANVLDLSTEQAIDWAIGQLLKSGKLRREAAYLFSI